VTASAASERPHGVPARQGKTYGLELVATGYAYPSAIVDNEAFFARAEFELNVDRAALARETRMNFRRWCAPGESTWTLARDATRKALAKAPSAGEEIDVVLVASGTTVSVLHPGDLENSGMPDLAPMVLADIGRNDALGVDIKACYCAGFLRLLETADALLANPNYRAALLVATEQGSRMSTAATNRSSFVFISSDAAGAAIVRKREGLDARAARSGLVDYVNFTEADKRDWAGIAPDGYSMVMKGARTGEAMLSAMVRSGQMLLARNGLTPSDVRWLLPIQTYAPMIDEAARQLAWPAEKVLWFGGDGGFAGSASIPSCLAEQIERGTVANGDLVLSIGVGTGISAGAALFYV
jgi:3-oxoacyl-[acyl-carrier-protein] synthase-3